MVWCSQEDKPNHPVEDRVVPFTVLGENEGLLDNKTAKTMANEDDGAVILIMPVRKTL